MLLYIFPNNSHDSVTNCFEFKCSFESIADSLFLSLSLDMFMLCVKTEKPHTRKKQNEMTKVFTKPNIPMSNTQEISKPNGYPKVHSI